MPDTAETHAEIRLSTPDVRDDLPFFTEQLGFQLERIYPADDPRIAVISGHGLRLRLEKGAPEPAGTIYILTDTPERFGARRLIAPNGTRIEIEQRDPPLVVPPTVHSFAVRRLADQAPWVIGRAGMQYRDLVPDRLGGAIIASHIRIPDGGPVPDMVHYHIVGFQLIFCYRGWVDLVYEDQGPPFRLHAGSCVIQPPRIRHRVLTASDAIEVIEIGVPAEHITTIDPTMTLPNDRVDPERRFDGQRFVHHQAESAVWCGSRLPGFAARDTTIADNTDGVAGVTVLKADEASTRWTTHDADILFTFVMEGHMTLEATDRPAQALTAGDAFTVPPAIATRYRNLSPDIELLEVALPGRFTTTVMGASER